MELFAGIATAELCFLVVLSIWFYKDHQYWKGWYNRLLETNENHAKARANAEKCRNAADRTRQKAVDEHCSTIRAVSLCLKKIKEARQYYNTAEAILSDTVSEYNDAMNGD